MSKKQNSCAFSACRCICGKESTYCSEFCENADEDQDECECDHEDCEQRSGIESDWAPIPR